MKLERAPRNLSPTVCVCSSVLKAIIQKGFFKMKETQSPSISCFNDFLTPQREILTVTATREKKLVLKNDRFGRGRNHSKSGVYRE